MLLLFEHIAWWRDDLSCAAGSGTKNPRCGGGPVTSKPPKPFGFAQ